MAKRYTIQFNYLATINVSVEGDFHDEGEALQQAREIAEDADINQFSLVEEKESRILSVDS